MRCSGCGKDVPFGGQVCPYCHRDKRSDQTGTVATGVGLVIGGVIGNAIGGFMGMVIGGFILGTVFAIVSMSGKTHSTKKPPRVRVEPPAALDRAPAVRPATDEIERRLRRLDKLRADGLVSDDEHEAQRRAIIATL